MPDEQGSGGGDRRGDSPQFDSHPSPRETFHSSGEHTGRRRRRENEMAEGNDRERERERERGEDGGGGHDQRESRWLVPRISRRHSSRELLGLKLGVIGGSGRNRRRRERETTRKRSGSKYHLVGEEVGTSLLTTGLDPQDEDGLYFTRGGGRRSSSFRQEEISENIEWETGIQRGGGGGGGGGGGEGRKREEEEEEEEAEDDDEEGDEEDDRYRDTMLGELLRRRSQSAWALHRPLSSSGSGGDDSERTTISSHGFLPAHTWVTSRFLSEALEVVGWGRFHWLLLLLIGLIAASDELENVMIIFITPALVCNWGISPSAQAVLSGMLFIGMMVRMTSSGNLDERCIYTDINIVSSVTSFIIRYAPCIIYRSSFSHDTYMRSTPIYVKKIKIKKNVQVGSSFWGYVSDTQGRRIVVLGTSAVCVAFGVLSSMSQTFLSFLIFRFLVGFMLSAAHAAQTYVDYM